MPTTDAPTKKASRKATKAVRKPTKVARKAVKRVKPAAGKPAKVSRKAVKRVKPAAAKPAKRTSKTAGGDAIAVLKQDHHDVEQLFKRFERAGDGARVAKRKLVDRMIEELSRHAEIEEEVFYPAVRGEVDDADSDVLEALEEHHVVKVVLRELEDLHPGDERFDAKVTVMIENVRHHVHEEEDELFPEVRQQLERGRLLELGDELRAAKPRVPTRPHPNAPDEPPVNVLVGGAVAALDRARTVGKRAVGRVRDEVS